MQLSILSKQHFSLTLETFPCDPVPDSENAFRTGRISVAPDQNAVRLPSSQLAELVSKLQEFNNQMFPEKIAVLHPDGSHAYWATADQARKLIRERNAVGLGNARKFYKIRLTAEADRSEKFVAGLKASTLANVPVIRPYEMLAPSPRRHFGFTAAVNRRLRGSSQHGVYAHSLANQLRVEAVVSG